MSKKLLTVKAASAPALDAQLLDGVPRELLPPMALEMMASCGAQAAAQLMMWQPGARLYVPKLAEREHVLVEVMGWAGFKGLVARYGDQRIALPKLAQLMRALRNAAIVRAYGQGASVNELALRYGLTARNVEKVLAAPGLLDADASMAGARVGDAQMALAL
jgi:Mor transcription activator family